MHGFRRHRDISGNDTVTASLSSMLRFLCSIEWRIKGMIFRACRLAEIARKRLLRLAPGFFDDPFHAYAEYPFSPVKHQVTREPLTSKQVELLPNPPC